MNRKRSSALLTCTGVLFLALMSLSVFPASATIFSEDGSNMTEETLYTLTNQTIPADTNRTIEFYYDPECGACTPAHEYMEQYIANHPGTQVTLINLSSGQQAEDQLNERYIAYNREYLNIPVVFIGPVGLEGTREIIRNFEGLLTWYNRSG